MNILDILTGSRALADVIRFIDPNDGMTKRAMLVTTYFDEPRRRVVVSGSIARPADVTAYAAGDIIANSATPASVLPITFPLAAKAVGGTGEIIGARATVLAASGTVALPNFDLLVFRPATISIPFAAGGYPGDNLPATISAAAQDELVAVFNFIDTKWRNSAGGVTAAGVSLYQSVNAQALSGRTTAPFSLLGAASNSLLGIVIAQNAWNPGAVINTIKVQLDIVQD